MTEIHLSFSQQLTPSHSTHSHSGFARSVRGSGLSSKQQPGLNRLSFFQSLRKAEDDMLLSTFSLGKVIQNGGKAEKSRPAASLERYKIDDSNFLDEEEDGAPKFSTIGSKHHIIGHGQPLNLGIKQLPYFSLDGPLALPADAEIQSIESVQERRETGDDENSAKLPIGRRDFDMLRCMLGRVYRPCWQV